MIADYKKTRVNLGPLAFSRRIELMQEKDFKRVLFFSMLHYKLQAFSIAWLCTLLYRPYRTFIVKNE